jgi:hypothetical protein
VRIYPNRNPSRRRRLIEWSVVLVIGAAMEGFLFFYLIDAFRTGVVKSLRRGSRYQVRYDVEPGWYLFNMCWRVLAFLLFAYGLVLAWRELRKALRK